MNKLFTKIAALALGMTMATGVGVAVATSSNAAKSADATITPSEESGLTVLTSSNFSTDAEYVLKSTDGYYWNGVSGTSSSKWGGITKTLSGVARVTIDGTWSNGFTIKDASDNYLRATTGNMTWATTQAGTFKMGTDTASNPIVYNGTSNGLKVNGTSGMRLYTNLTYNASTGKSVALYQIPKTLSSISVSTAPTKTSYTAGDHFDPTGLVIRRTYSDASYDTYAYAGHTSEFTFSPSTSTALTTSHTSVTITYSEKTCSQAITVSAATTPTITLSSYSLSGYTGQSFSVTSTYANLTSDFAWSTSGAGTISGGVSGTTGDSRDGTSTYSGTLTGAGTKTLSASGGGADTQNYVITITQTAVSLNKNSTSIAQGKSETLTATSNAGSSFTWKSSNTSAATVSNGVVSVPSNATVGATSTITATSTVDTNVSATCTVTVTEAPLADVLDSNVIPSAAVGSSTSTWGTASTFSDYTGAVYTGRFMGVSSSSFIGRLNDSTNGYIYTSTVPSNMKLKSVTIESMTASKTVGVYAQSGAYTAAPSDKSTALGTITPSSLTYEFAEDSNYNAICLRGHTSATEIGTVTITYQALKTLSNITLSGSYPTTFTKGDTFSHSGMVVTANYSDSTSATVTGSATWSTPDMSTTGVKTVTVSYSDEHGSASKTYSITVNYAAPTSITLSSYSTSVALEETFDLSGIDVTINPSATADQTAYAWSLYDDGGLVEDEDYVWISPEIMSYKAGTFVFRCTSTEDGTKYAEFTLEVSGDPIAHLKDEGDHDVTDGSMTVFADAGIISFAVTTENFQGTLTYTWSSSNTSIIDIDADADDMCDYEVKAAGSARLSCRIQGSIKGDVTVYVDVTVSAVTVTSVTWTAPTIDVFSGATLTTSDVSSWNVKYSTDSGKTDQSAPVGSTTVKIGGSAVSLPHTWVAADNGKTLGVEYGGVSSSTTTVTVTQTINAVYAPNVDTHTVSWTATAANNLGSQISSQGGTDEGTISTGDYEWDYTRTLVSLASNKSDYIAFQGETWIQLGSGNALESLEFTTSAIPGTIKSVSVVAATAGTHALTIDVGGTKYLEDESLHVYSGTAAAANPDPDDCVKTGTGSSSGAITITIAQSGSTKKAMVIRSISVTYETEGSGTTNIANNASHKAAQRAAVAYAQAFNAAMDETENCTTGLDDAWATCSSAYTAFKSAAAALGSTEEAWALNLVKYATAQWSDDSGEACIERMMKTYEVCVQKHGKTAFMSDLVTLGRVSNTNPISLIGNNVDTNAVAIIVIVSVISVSAIGGYFFLRRRKEN